MDRTQLQRLTLLLLALPAAAHAQSPAPQQLPPVEVIGTSPLPGQGVDRELLPYGTQGVRRATLDQAQSDNVTDYLARRLPGAQVNEIQGSPFQADLTYRGFRASGLLGASQGLSVYLDGVRINEPFGDVVNWDLVPEFAIESLTLVPGANPAFGLNTLGGAIAITTANGLTAPGTQLSLSAGSFGRLRVDTHHGGEGKDGWHYYVGGTAFDEEGWRDQSEGRLGQFMAKLGRVDGALSYDLGLLAGRSRLIGNGLVPASSWDEDDGPNARVGDLYSRRRSAIYSHPDFTRNDLVQTAFNLRYEFSPDTELAGLVYLRSTRRATVNGDTADDAEEGSEANASFNTTATRQRAWGLATSLGHRTDVHQMQFGAAVDASRTRFRQSEQEGFFTPDRGVIAGDEDAELSARVVGDSVAYGLYATDTMALAETTHLTGTLRINHARVSNQLDTVDDDTGELEEQPKETFRYTSANPAVGLAHKVSSGLTVFANVARNNRVPTVIELGCADPEEPCRLPAGLQSDPYLKQVKSTTYEIGARIRPAPAQKISISLYRTDNRNDIVFGSVSATSQLGYFRNFARTRHEGVDAEWQGRFGPLTAQASYSHLRATYQARDTLRIGERNIEVEPGMQMAGMPRHTVKLGADWRFLPAWSVGADVQWLSARGVLGNEDKRVEDGDDERVNLRLPSYSVTNLRLSYSPAPALEFFVRVGNVFDRRYESYGALAETVFDTRGNYSGDERAAVFVAPGAPRNVWVGLRARF